MKNTLKRMKTPKNKYKQLNYDKNNIKKLNLFKRLENIFINIH